MKTLITLLFAVIATSVWGQTNPFVYHQIYVCDNQIQNVSSGDINGDRIADVVISESMNNNVLWFRNDGNGNFARDTIGIFSMASSVRICDIDSDLDNDVLVASGVNSEIVLFINNGTGVFTKKLISDDVEHPNAIAAADIDDDGDCDIVCASSGAGEGVTLFINQGNCTFSGEILSCTANSTCVEIFDIDNDGDLDIISNEYGATGGILVYKQINHQAFEEVFIENPWTNSIAVSDVNGDGLSDILSAACGSQIAVFYNNNSNFFQKSTLSYDFSCGVSAIATDFNGDSKTDIVAASWGENIIGYWVNVNNTSFAYQSISESIINPSCVIYDDVNNDSKNDIICVSSTGYLVWLENQNVNSLSDNSTNESAFTAYYDHTDNLLSINTGKLTGIERIKIINTVGQVVIDRNMKSAEQTFDCNGLPAGTYVINLESVSNSYSQKFIL